MGENQVPIFALRLDDEDRALVDALSAKEKLTKTDVIRRAIRHYAQHLEVKPKKGRGR